MSTWQENVFNNGLVIFILSDMFVIIYTKVKNITIPQMYNEIKELFVKKLK